jgi:hypothetical protein
VFGKVLSGMDVVYMVKDEGMHSGTPKSKVVNGRCDELIWSFDGTVIRSCCSCLSS